VPKQLLEAAREVMRSREYLQGVDTGDTGPMGGACPTGEQLKTRWGTTTLTAAWPVPGHVADTAPHAFERRVTLNTEFLPW